MNRQSVSEQAVLEALRGVQDPELGRDIVSLGFVQNVRISDNTVSFDLELTTPACPLKDQLKSRCERCVLALPGIERVEVNIKARVRSVVAGQGQVLEGVKNVVAIASGKGGVGKSTVATNLALALAESGSAVGLLDGDIYGPSIPTMMGLDARAMANAATGRIEPLQRYGIKLMSMGFIATDDTPVIWRGPLVHKVLVEFIGQVDWGQLDYLVIDLPPGTGDAQLSLTQTARLSGAVIVTTPQEVSLLDARKGLRMFQQVNVPVLGIVENMSYFVCGHCGQRTDIFRYGGGRRVSQELGVALLGEIPIEPAVAEAGDKGVPVLAYAGESRAAAAYRKLAGAVAARLSVLSYEPGASAGK